MHVLTGPQRRPAAGTTNIAAGGAGNVSFAMLLNNYRQLEQYVFVHGVWVASQVSPAVLIRRPTAAITGLTLVTTRSWRDFRNADPPIASMHRRNNAGSPTGVSFERVKITPMAAALYIPLGITLSAGGTGDDALVVQADSGNEDIEVTFLWDEPALPL